MTTNIVSRTPQVERNEWRTPAPVFAWASRLLGGIDFDTACTAANSLAPPIWCRDIAELGDWQGDALAVEWYGRCFNNPPYDKIDPWVVKAISSKRAITAMLIPAPNGEERYELLAKHSHEINIIGRIPFIRMNGVEIDIGQYDIFDGLKIDTAATGDDSSNTRGSSLFIINGYGQGSRSVITRDEIWAQYQAGYIRGKVEVRA